MPNYDFNALLEPLEFQDLVCDIVQLRDNIFLEGYKEGRDFGIDGLYTDSTQKIIVQAKRYKQEQKMKIMELFEGYINNTRDIISNKDLNNLLRAPSYKNILGAFPKLWSPNLAILEKS